MIRQLTVGASFALALATLNACNGALEGQPSGPRDDRVGGAGAESDGDAANEPGASDGAEKPGETAEDAGAPGVAPSGLPCEVSELLASHCIACHRAPPVGGAHVALLTLEDLSAPSPSRAGLSVAQEAYARMTSSGSDRMPPGGAQPSAEGAAAFGTWVSQGLPPGDCSSLEDAGLAQPDPAFEGPTVCTSEERWTEGDDGSPLMHPGRACIDCHTREDEGPDLTLGGTVFHTGHEPDDCLGVDGRAAEVTIEVTDATGAVVTMAANRSGNFLSREAVTFPITARVLYEGRARAMLGAVNRGDCNSCHTTEGRENAPGRIALP